MSRRLPITLVGGFLGAGKTSFLHHAVSEHQGGHLALFVENPGPLNLDAKAIGGLCGAMRRLNDRVLEIPASDETMQIDWIAERLQECARSGQFERVLMEIGGTANAARLGQPLVLSEKIAPWAELQQVICVVDALDFYRTQVASPPDQPHDPLSDFQREQISGASLLVLNKCDLVDEAQRQACTRHLRSLHPTAPIVETDYGEVPAEIWSRAGVLPEPETAHANGKAHGEESAPLSSVLYRAYRPFHPERFWTWFNAEHSGLLRVKGIVWLASRNLLVGGVSRTRWQNGCGGAGIWWAALPREEWPEETEALMKMQETWREPYGDRRQELVLIGNATLLPGIVRQLDTCLLNAEESSRPVSEWATFSDPFPAWDLDEG